MFGHKLTQNDYDEKKSEPVIRCSICTGEQVAGIIDRKSGKFEEIMLIRNPEDLETFKRKYNVKAIRKIY